MHVMIFIEVVVAPLFSSLFGTVLRLSLSLFLSLSLSLSVLLRYSVLSIGVVMDLMNIIHLLASSGAYIV